MSGRILRFASINALGTALYITLIAFFLTNLENIFRDTPDTILAPISMIMLFVFSAAVTGSLVLGRPILWYLDGKKKPAILLFVYTLMVLMIFIIIAFFLLILFRLM